MRFQTKTRRFENTLESGSKQKRIHIVLVSTVEIIKIKTMTENIAGTCVCRALVEFNLLHNVQSYRFSVDSRKRSKTVVRTRID